MEGGAGMYPMNLVEFCNANMQKGSDEVFRKLDEDNDIDVLDYECTNNCGICSKAMFAIVNGQLVGAQSAPALLEKVYKQVERQKQAEDDWDFL